ncbi:MAG TPA: TspO/MBR family protein [Burkholderiales bacterium]|nr:TspO/MBR family protein [Burkholderiales bacterium]
MATALLPFLTAVALTAFFGSRFEPGVWYSGLAKAPWTPPNWVFAPAWTVLYVAIAIAGWLAWRAQVRAAELLVLWIGQLVLNGAWSWLFFGRRDVGLALVDIALLTALAGVFALRSRGSSPAAAWLFVPYVLWLCYAASLNFYVWRYNP